MNIYKIEVEGNYQWWAASTPQEVLDCVLEQDDYDLDILDVEPVPESEWDEEWIYDEENPHPDIRMSLREALMHVKGHEPEFLAMEDN